MLLSLLPISQKCCGGFNMLYENFFQCRKTLQNHIPIPEKCNKGLLQCLKNNMKASCNVIQMI